MEADFARFYRLDLRRALWGPGPVGVRRLLVLVRQLPAESATVRAVTHGWTFEADVAALTAELVDLVARAHGVKKDPLRVPRPWRPAAAAVKPRAVSAAALMAKLREG